MLRRRLVYFDSAARHGSIRKAADAMNVASSAVNRQILMLERDMGVPLFERLPRGIRPTAAGEVLLGYIRRWGSEERALVNEIESLKQGVRGTLRIAAAESICETILPEALIALSRRYPLIDFRIVSGDNARLTSELLTQNADIVVAFDMVEHERADVVQMISTPLGIVARKDHPIASCAVAGFADYAPHPFVLPGDEWLRHSSVRKLLEGRNAPPHVVARAERPGILKGLVRAGLGIAFLTRLGSEQNEPGSDLAWVPLAAGIAEPALVALMVPRERASPIGRMVLADIVKESMRRAS